MTHTSAQAQSSPRQSLWENPCIRAPKPKALAFPLILLTGFFHTGDGYSQSQTMVKGVTDLETLSSSQSVENPHQSILGVDLGFGPFIGGGTGSDGMDVRYASGFELNLSKVFTSKTILGARVALGPQIALSNTMVSTKSERQTDKSLNRYDHRTGLLGAKIKWAEAYGLWSTPLYTTLSGGITFSKLSIDKTTSNSFQQIDINRIVGRVIQGEIGSEVRLADGLNAQIAWVSTSYRLDQTQSQGTFKGEYLGEDSSLGLLEGTYTPETIGISPRPSLKIWALKVGLSAAL